MGTNEEAVENAQREGAGIEKLGMGQVYQGKPQDRKRKKQENEKINLGGRYSNVKRVGVYLLMWAARPFTFNSL